MSVDSRSAEIVMGLLGCGRNSHVRRLDLTAPPSHDVGARIHDKSSKLTPVNADAEKRGPKKSEFRRNHRPRGARRHSLIITSFTSSLSRTGASVSDMTGVRVRLRDLEVVMEARIAY